MPNGFAVALLVPGALSQYDTWAGSMDWASCLELAGSYHQVHSICN